MNEELIVYASQEEGAPHAKRGCRGSTRFDQEAERESQSLCCVLERKVGPGQRLRTSQSYYLSNVACLWATGLVSSLIAALGGIRAEEYQLGASEF